jgi:hypothetical protein
MNVAGLSAGEAAISTRDVFLRAAGLAGAMDGGLGRDLELRSVDMSLSESARRDLGLAVSNRPGRTDGADIA